MRAAYESDPLMDDKRCSNILITFRPLECFASEDDDDVAPDVTGTPTEDGRVFGVKLKALKSRGDRNRIKNRRAGKNNNNNKRVVYARTVARCF